MGRANERIARIQESYVAHATTSWLESLERSLAQMKEYQVTAPYPIPSQVFNSCRPHAKNSRIDDLPMILLSQKCRRLRRKIIASRKSSDLRKPNMKNPARTCSGGCRTSRRLKRIALLILGLYWMLSLNTTTDVGMN